MSRYRPKTAGGDLRHMLALLAHERSALLRGDFVRLEKLGVRKTALLSRLEVADPGSDPSLRDLLGQVRAAAARNATLFDAALAGVRDAHALVDLARNPPPGRVYARNGARRTLDSVRVKLERRA
jgi:hypothetical protein